MGDGHPLADSRTSQPFPIQENLHQPIFMQMFFHLHKGMDHFLQNTLLGSGGDLGKDQPPIQYVQDFHINSIDP
jgi:hypothetical protein